MSMIMADYLGLLFEIFCQSSSDKPMNHITFPITLNGHVALKSVEPRRISMTYIKTIVRRTESMVLGRVYTCNIPKDWAEVAFPLPE